MKGIAIAIETIIYLILGITVLSVSMAFFFGIGGKPQTCTQLESDRQRYCGAYITNDITCAGKNGEPTGGSGETFSKLLGDIKKTCESLSRSCGTQMDCGTDLKCVQTCCILCARKPS